MICVNQNKLVVFLSLFLAVDAWHDWWGADDKVNEQPHTENPHKENPHTWNHHTGNHFPNEFDHDDAVVIINPLPLTGEQFPDKNKHHTEKHFKNKFDHDDAVVIINPLPLTGEQFQDKKEPSLIVAEPVVQLRPVRFEQVVKSEMIEAVFNEILPVSLITRNTFYSTVTQTDTFWATAFQRSTVTVTPPPVLQTITKIIQSVYMVEAAAVRTKHQLITETQLAGRTITSTSTKIITVTTQPFLDVVVEAQTTETEWQPYTVTTTGIETVTKWETRPFDVLELSRVRVPIVSIKTLTRRIPHYKTMTNWVTMTTTETMCNRQNRVEVNTKNLNW